MLLVDFYVNSASAVPPPLNLVFGWWSWLQTLYRICGNRLKSQAERDKALQEVATKKQNDDERDKAAGAGRVPLGQEHRDETRAYHAYLQQRDVDDSSMLDARVIKVSDNVKVG
jgi:hypothetical protein